MTTIRRIAGTASEWLREGRRVVLALLVEIEGSAPLESGALMLIAENGAIEGSITGGCVEAAVVDEANAIFGGADPHIVSYGISDEAAGSVGLTCGGTVHVFVQELSGAEARVEATAREAVAAGRPVAIATLLDGCQAGRKQAVVDGLTSVASAAPSCSTTRSHATPRGCWRRAAAVSGTTALTVPSSAPSSASTSTSSHRHRRC